jgi:molecular chaperone GrpE
MSGNGAEGTEEPAVENAPASAEPEVDERDTRIAELEAKLRDTEGRLRAVSKAYADQRAEMNAFRQRMESQDKLRVERKEFEVVQTFFDPVQNLHRSLEAGGGDGLVEGLRMVHQQFMDALHRLGLERVPGVGAPFDPSVHEAIDTTPVSDPADDGRVVAVHVDGWMVRGRALKPAQVSVGRHVPGSAEA